MAGYTVTNVSSDQVENANQDLVNVYDVTFTVDPDRGQFTVQVPQNVPDVVTAAQERSEERRVGKECRL